MEQSTGSKPHACFEIEKIIGISSDGNYQVQWAPAWVSKFHLVGCQHLIEEFLQKQSDEINAPQNEVRFGKADPTTHMEVPSHDPSHSVLINEAEHNHWSNGHKERLPSDSEAYKVNTKETYTDQQTELEHNTERNPKEQCGVGTVEAVPSESADEISIKIEDDETSHDNVETSPLSMICNMYAVTSSANPVNAPLSPTTIKQLNQLATSRGKATKSLSHTLKTTEASNSKGTHSTSKCSICGLQTPNRSSLRTHLGTHTGDKPYTCHICHKSFSHGDNLRTHLRLHTGEKPYSCSACGEAFTHRPTLMRHYKTCELWCGEGE